MLLKIMFVLVFQSKAFAQEETSEPACYSRFDYDYKMMKTLMDVDNTLTDLQNKVTIQENTIQQLSENQIGGSTYVRWGRTTCLDTETELVYSGYAGGSFYADKGAAVDYVCLPKDPEWAKYDDGLNAGAKMYGGEYQFDNLQKILTPGLHQNDAPCAVCRTRRPTVIMIPAKRTCYPGWTLEYTGYLAAGSTAYDAASQYICLDGEPEMLPNGSENKNGKLFYFVEARCGILPCPPYVNGRELTCVVCSK